MTDLTAALTRTPVIAILRGCPPQHVEEMAGAAWDAGIAALEITLDSKGPIVAIRTVADAHPGLVVGAGTVRSERDVADAVDAGARFIVSPHLDPDVVAAASSARVMAIPGAATATEVWQATRAGADLVKLFPARHLGGPGYVAAILGPLGGPSLIPTGGVEPSNAAAFLAAGATALGVGRALFPSIALEAGDTAAVARRCRSLVTAIQ